ncbi:hypothetical protein [Halobacteriovorax sp. HLS]|uniref:hypothetical protein n=1 Tax=Halobacteriovorax sp. HLS TaxID=2234000 RepID=UPI000FD73BD3|nr:hypothetical protein [Halobacteriovorax sp. HLS]
MYLLRILILSLLCISSFSAEIDSYTYISSHKSSGVSFMNRSINKWLEEATNQLNAQEISCPENVEQAQDFYEIVRKSISRPFVGHSVAVYFDENLAENQITRTPMWRSIYNQMTWYEGFSLNLKGLLGVTVDRGRKIGVDKLGHFFVEGWGFYKRAYLKGESGEVNIDNALRWGKFTERTYFGMTTTGVYSNADLVANYNGMRFWNQLLLFNPDPVFNRGSQEIKSPLFSCREGKWKRNRYFSLYPYLDNGWDEQRNCNSYDSYEIEEHVKIQAAMKMGFHELSKREGRICPLKANDCSYEIRKYGKYAKDILHESCFDDSKAYIVEVPEINPMHILGNGLIGNSQILSLEEFILQESSRPSL